MPIWTQCPRIIGLQSAYQTYVFFSGFSYRAARRSSFDSFPWRWYHSYLGHHTFNVVTEVNRHVKLYELKHSASLVVDHSFKKVKNQWNGNRCLGNTSGRYVVLLCPPFPPK